MNTIFGNFGWELGGGTKRRGRAQREFCPSRFGRERGDTFAAAACQLAAFSSKMFSDWSIGIFLLKSISARWAGWENSMWCERMQLNSGTYQTVKSSFAEERSNIFFLVQTRELSAAVLYFACSSNWSKPEWLKYLGLRTSQWRSSVPWKARACEG